MDNRTGSVPEGEVEADPSESRSELTTPLVAVGAREGASRGHSEPQAAKAEASDVEGIAEKETAAAKSGTTQVNAATPSEGDAFEAKDAVAHLFGVLGIQRVVSVDDDYEGTIDDFLAMAAVAAGTDSVELFGAEFDLGEPEEVWRTEIGERWRQATDTERHLLMARAKKQTGHSDPEDQPDAAALQPLMPDADAVEFIALTPEEWTKRRGAILESGKAIPTLVLLDRDMGDRGDEGLRFAEEVFASDVSGDNYVALLTRTITKGGEIEAWKLMTDSYAGLVPDRFLVVSKSALGPDPHSFPRSIKSILVARPAAILKRLMRDAIVNGIGMANEEIDSLSPDEFQRMIFGASSREGVWEPESLLRVFQIFMRNRVRSTIYASNDVRSNATQVRRLCSIDTQGPPDTAAAIATQRAELYDLAEHVNPVHLPIELGDVFRVPSGVEYVLAEQPCDLMIRFDGERGNKIHDALLLQIDATEPGPNQGHLVFELPFYFSDGRSAWVKLNRPVFVPIAALEMTVFDADGNATFDPKANRPENLWPAWDKRYDVLAAGFLSLQSTFEQIEKLRSAGTIDAAVYRQLMDSLLHVDKSGGRKIKGKWLSDGTVRYDLQRVRRILPMRSSALLSRYALHRARDAFDFDLAALG